MKKILILSVAVAAMLFTACGPKEEEIVNSSALQGIKLAPSSVTLEEGESVKLHVKYTPDSAKATAPKVLWYSDKQRVASVNEEGLVTADRVGTAVITATCGKFEAKCTVEVTKLELPQPEPDPQINFSLSTELINAPAKGGTFDITITTDTTWKAACEKSWAHLSQTEGKGNATIQVTVDPADSESTLTQKITFSVGKGKYFVTIQRKGKIMAITIDQSQIDVPVTGGTYTVNVTSGNEEWDVDVNYECYYLKDHITYTKSGNSVTFNVGKYNYKYDGIFNKMKWVYESKEYRHFDANFTDGDLKTTLRIVQHMPYAGASGIPSNNGYDENTAKEQTSYTIHIECNFPWSLYFTYSDEQSNFRYHENCISDFATVSPSSGTGDADVVVTVTPRKKNNKPTGGSANLYLKGIGDWSEVGSIFLGDFYVAQD